MASQDGLIVSVSGIRGVIGRGLTPEVAASFAAAAPGEEQPSSLIGQPVSLVVQPDTIRLSGPRAMQYKAIQVIGCQMLKGADH